MDIAKKNAMQTHEQAVERTGKKFAEPPATYRSRGGGKGGGGELSQKLTIGQFVKSSKAAQVCLSVPPPPY
jgi:hypothetical protein